MLGCYVLHPLAWHRNGNVEVIGGRADHEEPEFLRAQTIRRSLNLETS